MKRAAQNLCLRNLIHRQPNGGPCFDALAKECEVAMELREDPN
jgi:hypothetical protein